MFAVDLTFNNSSFPSSFNYLFIKGVLVIDRQILIQVLILPINLGGCGLNLTVANNIIFIEPQIDATMVAQVELVASFEIYINDSLMFINYVLCK